jgi:hypothetical protein
MSKLIRSSFGSLPYVPAAPAIVHMQAYANGLTNMIPTLYRVLDIVSRELIGFIPSVTLNADAAERVAIGQQISWHKSGTFTVSDVEEKMTVDTPADRTPGNDTMTITDSKKVDFGWTGEDERKLTAPGVGMAALMQSDFAQALRVLANYIESAIAVEAYNNASRATGTAGTTPFGSDIGATADLRKILDDNGAPPGMRSLIINTNTAANMRKLGHLNKVNEAGTSMTLRQGELDMLHNFSVKESAASVFNLGHTKGTGASATTNNAGYAVGATVITLASAGTGTIKAGDVITFAGDTNKYVVRSGDADVSNGGTITLSEPGLRVAIPTAATNITVGNSYQPNVGFSADAIRLLARPPSKPSVGDARIDDYILVDDRSGLAFEISVWPGQRMVTYQVALAFGVKAIKRDNIALLLG